MKQQQQNLVVINGKTYDASSGLIVHQNAPISASAPHQQALRATRPMHDIAPAAKATPAQMTAPTAHHASHTPHGSPHSHHTPRVHPDIAAHKIHRAPQKTHTLHRAATQAARLKAAEAEKPTVQLRHHAQAIVRHQRAQEMPVVDGVQRFQHKAVSHHTPTQGTSLDEVRPSLTIAQLQAQHAPIVHSQLTPELPAATQQPHQLKEALIQQRLAEAPDTHHESASEPHHRVNKFFSRQPRMWSAAAGALCVMLLVGYVTYLNMPAISMRVAASRAGFAAAMPTYKPSGYSLRGPVAYSPGQVTLNFASNTNSENFSLMQKESNWDSQALLDNYVSKQTGNYLTYQEKGLTVYMYDGKASWVNGGVWFNIEGKAQLSSDQILKLATSM